MKQAPKPIKYNFIVNGKIWITDYYRPDTVKREFNKWLSLLSSSNNSPYTLTCRYEIAK